MRLLLDTHIAVWAVTRNQALPSRWTEAIEDADNEVVVSVASLWEIAIKNNLDERRGARFEVTLDQAAIAFEEAGFVLLPLGLPALREVERLPRLHGDPFDRLLVATALADGWRLLTHDRQLGAYGPSVIAV